ncbi:N-ethylammeline chlorohydrolase [Streptococcus pneumoniae]|nr:N-ethylammeline chlorohydrolase [Streptococcus pneumoniae]
MKIKEQTRKLAAGCSKHCFEVVDRTDEVSSKQCFEVVDRTNEVINHIYSKATLTWFEEIFEEYKMMGKAGQLVFFDVYRLVRQVS